MSLNVIVAFLLSLILSLLTTRQVILFSNKRNIGDSPSEGRKVHKKITPNLGGIGVFIGTCVAYFAFSDYSMGIRPDKLFSISIFLFFVGVRDDLNPMGAITRLLIEFVCALFIIYITDIRITTLWGIFGIDEISVVVSYILTSIFIVGCVNSYNFIDGLDGLLGSIALLGAICFGLIFNIYGEWLWTLLSVAICGGLLGFLFFNWYPSRIFMGDGGALFLGTIFACFALHVMQLPPISGANVYSILAPHTIAFSIIAVPVVDMVTVFVLRTAHGYSLVKADNRHAHHRLFALKLNHATVTLIILAANISIILFAYLVQSQGALRSLIYTIAYCFALELLLIYIVWLCKKYNPKTFEENQML